MRYIYCHPLFDERKCAHRFSYALKNTFESAGLNLERFDYYGTGEAKGSFSNVCLETLMDDIKKEINNSEASLIGLRFGASLSLDFCLRHNPKVKKLILIEPIIDGKKYVEYLYRKQLIKNLMTGEEKEDDHSGYVNLEGYKTSIKFIEQIKTLDLTNTDSGLAMKNNIFIVQISKRSKIEPDLSTTAGKLQKLAQSVYVENIFLPVFWERIPSTDYSELTQKILRFCCG